MKRFLCLLMCMLMIASSAFAETLPEKFHRQIIVSGNGLKGTVSLTASGVAEWLTYLLPFTATELQLRAIGEAQGGMSYMIDDDEDWQIKLYAKDAEGGMQALTYLYGDPDAIYLKSDLIPGVVLSTEADQVHLLYQLIQGEFLDIFLGLDPWDITVAEEGANPTIYSALASLLGVSEEEAEAQWAPVLEKYYTELDLWLNAYTQGPEVTGSTGTLSMKTTYTIPSEDLKAQAKHIIGLMLYDYDLQTLLSGFMTVEQRAIYLNPALVYFYHACIDTLPLEGNVMMEREMNAMGETLSMAISLPLPPLPSNLTDPIGELAANVFQLPYTDLLRGVSCVTIRQKGDDVTFSLSGGDRTIEISTAETASNAETFTWNGFITVTPAAGVNEPPLCAGVSFRTSHTIWQDEEWVKYEQFNWSLAVEPDLSVLAADDPFKSSYVHFAPFAFEAKVVYSNATDIAERPVKLAIDLSAQLPDAEIALHASIKGASGWMLETLPTSGAEPIEFMTDDRKAELLSTFTVNAVNTMMSLHASDAEAPADAAGTTEAPAQDQAPVPTVVPSM